MGRLYIIIINAFGLAHENSAELVQTPFFSKINSSVRFGTWMEWTLNQASVFQHPIPAHLASASKLSTTPDIILFPDKN